jgi:nanoRNase/pAp phosphatase (c-di-AMP/oligoRNAs hydrolase)
MMETYGGGGHRAVGGANPENLQAARTVAAEIANKLISALQVG